MKKFILFIITVFILAVSATTAKAQDASLYDREVWVTTQIEGDELRGTDTQDVTIYRFSNGDYIVNYASRPNMLVIILDKGIFDFNYDDEKALIGYYDTDGNLVKKETTYLFKLGTYSKGFLGGADVMNYMRNNEGYIRIVADKHLGNDFDVKVPTWRTMSPKRTIEKID